MLVYMLSNDRSINARRMSLIPYSLLMLELSLRPVPRSGIIVDLLLYVSRNLGRYVLVVSVDLLVVNYGLHFLEEFNFGTLSVDGEGERPSEARVRASDRECESGCVRRMGLNETSRR